MGAAAPGARLGDLKGAAAVWRTGVLSEPVTDRPLLLSSALRPATFLSSAGSITLHACAMPVRSANGPSRWAPDPAVGSMRAEGYPKPCWGRLRKLH